MDYKKLKLFNKLYNHAIKLRCIQKRRSTIWYFKETLFLIMYYICIITITILTSLPNYLPFLGSVAIVNIAMWVMIIKMITFVIRVNVFVAEPLNLAHLMVTTCIAPNAI